jgi:hypothetical protein
LSSNTIPSRVSSARFLNSCRGNKDMISPQA